MAALPLPTRLRQSLTRKIRPRVLEAQFGDGYREVAKDGIRDQLEVIERCGWDHLNGAERSTVYSFLSSVGTTGFVEFTPPWSSTPKRYRITSNGWSEEYVSGDLCNITFDLQEE